MLWQDREGNDRAILAADKCPDGTRRLTLHGGAVIVLDAIDGMKYDIEAEGVRFRGRDRAAEEYARGIRRHAGVR